MLGRTLGRAVSVVILLVGLQGMLRAQEPPMPQEPAAPTLKVAPFLYHEDFEEQDRVKPLTSSGVKKYEVNFKGLTEEQAFSGKKSFKLDLTFVEGTGSVAWYMPLSSIPAEGKLKFSCRMLIGEETKGGERVQLDIVNYIMPIRQYNAWTIKPYYVYECPQKAKRGEWISLELGPDKLIERSKRATAGFLEATTWGLKEENVGIYVYWFRFDIVGGAGNRVVLYLDDIKLEGEIPSDEDYRPEINRRWALAKASFNEQIGAWEKMVLEMQKETALATVPDEKKKLKEKVEQKMMQAWGHIKEAKKRGWFTAKDKDIGFALMQINSLISSMKEGKKETE